MRRTIVIGLVLIGILILVLPGGYAKSKMGKSEVPLPPSEANLPVIKAEPWLQVEADPNVFLEGPSFDREGNLYVTSIFDSRVFKITPNKKVTTIFNKKGTLPDGTAIHKDGRLFLACLSGALIAMNTDGSNVTYIEPRYQGKPKSLNDLVFDSKGNLYVTDFTGNFADPTGGVYRFSSDFKTVTPVIERLASANGIAFAPEGNVLWVSETCRNALDRIELLEDGITINPIAGATVPYRFTGGPGGCDSMRVDSEGNVYQCMIFQGRALILNKRGVPIAHVLLPGRDEGKHLGTANLAFKPDTNEVFIMAWGNGGAWIYKFRGLAKGLKLFSHQ
jgi:lactonase